MILFTDLPLKLLKQQEKNKTKLKIKKKHG